MRIFQALNKKSCSNSLYFLFSYFKHYATAKNNLNWLKYPRKRKKFTWFNFLFNSTKKMFFFSYKTFCNSSSEIGVFVDSSESSVSSVSSLAVIGWPASMRAKYNGLYLLKSWLKSSINKSVFCDSVSKKSSINFLAFPLIPCSSIYFRIKKNQFITQKPLFFNNSTLTTPSSSIIQW